MEKIVCTIFENYYIRAFLYLKEKARQKKQKNVPFYRFVSAVLKYGKSGSPHEFSLRSVAKIVWNHAARSLCADPLWSANALRRAQTSIFVLKKYRRFDLRYFIVFLYLERTSAAAPIMPASLPSVAMRMSVLRMGSAA